ncbi:hypothetical protein LOD99_7785 [Oopsacas minuta]|uniref:pseudouridine 5'-phosphatase n=1 Tax=Oopsacas minuta TaxID=111878 RepID=A0AAV7JQA2_9METZ|nr:hypothetical protein LOD99_7785 [Oopsacas minuta]
MATDSPSVIATHVIFDLDGLLLETESIYTQVTQSIINRFDKIYTWEVKSKVIGKPPLEATRTLLHELEISSEQLTPEQFLSECEEGFNKLFPTCVLMPGAELLIRHFHKLGIPLALATSSGKRHLDVKISRHQEIFSLFKVLVHGEDPEIKLGKPAPDIFQIAARRFPIPPKSPSDVIVFEDSFSGILAAKAANMNAVWIPDSNNKPTHEQIAIAHQVATQLDKVDLSMFSLPNCS